MNQIISAPGNSKNKDITISFPGQQWDEPILHIMRPHWTMIVSRLLRTFFFSGLSLFAWWRINNHLPDLFSTYEFFGYMIAIGAMAVFSWWHLKYYSRLRAYITDRRIVRFQAVFPITETRRAIFWREVVKTRDLADHFIWRAVKIGTVELSSHLTEGGSEISFPFIYYFEDLVSYLDKIIHCSKENPEEIASIKPFVAKPRGMRYQDEEEKRVTIQPKK